MPNNQLNNLLTFVAIFLIGMIIGMLLFNRCQSIPQDKSDPITIIKHTRDTIWAKDTIFSFKNIKVPIKVKVTDTIYKVTPIDSTACNTVYLYHDSLVDTNIVIYYKDYVQGLLKSKDMSYKLKVPLKIIDSVKIKETIIVKPNFNLSVGSIVGPNILAPGVKVKFKKHEVGVNYNLISPTPRDGVIIHWKYILIEK
jgi:hypothetical protein